jgi:ribonuclease HI
VDKIAEFDVNFRIFTDGSTDGEQRNGGAGTYIEDGRGTTIEEFSVAAGAYCSSYGGECVAMLRAVTWIREHEVDNTELRSLILTDSDSLVSAIQDNSWKVKDEWLLEIKLVLAEIKSDVTILWVPSHCNIDGNEKADELAKTGTSKDQSTVPITHSIRKAKIKARRWEVEHPRAKAMYKDRRKPQEDLERRWPRRVRTLFARLRSDHAKELNYYREKIKTSDTADCDTCGVVENIKHVLCDCPTLEEARVRNWYGKVSIDMMVTEPDVCRRILAHRYKALKIDKSDCHQKPSSTM